MLRAQTRPPERFVHVLDHDSGLRSVLPEPERSRARQHAIAAIAELSHGRWNPGARPGADADLGLLVLGGLLIREVTVTGSRCGELVGPGSLLRLWDDSAVGAPMRHDVGWQVVEPARIAVLDEHFLRVVAHWPALIAALVGRATERVHDLAVLVSIHSLRRVDMRLHAFFWHLADRYGKVTAGGVLIPFALTHRQLALLIGAQRPSVTSALGALAEQGLVRRDHAAHWLLTGDPPSGEEADVVTRRTSAASA
jgi:CRP/FNR family cyclic AMP-dependent transcriptional regulator